MKKTFFLPLIIGLPFFVQAQKGLTTKSVSIFKDKSAFFVKKGTVKTDNKIWELQGDTIPAALNGTFWITSEDKVKMVKAFQKKESKETKQQVVVNTFMEMLALNNGKGVTLHFPDTFYVGKVLFMQTKKESEFRSRNELTAPLFALQMKNGKTMVFTKGHISKLVNLEFDETPQFLFKTKQNTSVTKPTLQVRFQSDKAKQDLNMMYLTKGLAWKPDYLIELLDDNKAKLTLRSTIVNDAEDIDTEKLNLVAGVPNFRYATGLSDLINFMKVMPAVAANRALRNNLNIISNSVPVYESNFPASPQTTLKTTDFGSGESLEDLYFYTIDKVQIKKGERAFLDVFTIEVPVEHTYECILNANKINYGTQYSFQQSSTPVQHTIKLKNKSKYVWTAGTAMVAKKTGNKIAPISQDKLSYTSRGNDISVKLTEAPDVNIKLNEEEVSREPNKKVTKRNKVSYYRDLVVVEAEMTVQNFKQKEIRLDLKRLLVGKLLKSSVEWQKSPRVRYNYEPNKQTDVCWEIKLKAGEKQVITYTYKYFTSEHR